MLKAIKKWLRGRKKPSSFFDQPFAMPQRQYGINQTNYYYDMPVAPMQAVGTINSLSTMATLALSEQTAKDLRVEKKPVEIVSEIIAKKPEIQVGAIDDQIKIVKARLKVLKRFNGQTGDELLALRYLKARKRFTKNEKLFPWAITTDAMISELVKKYQVQFVNFGSYSKSVPIEATDQLEKFSTAWEKTVDDEFTPDIKLITDYKGPEHKKDPILLAESPFGAWWYVLGAWDKEVEIVDDLVYKGK
jgi:hypothetical protein